MPPNRFPILRGPDAQQSRVQDNVQSVLSPLARALQGTPIMGASQPAWTQVQLLNGFTPTASPPSYQVDCIGRVHLRGRAAHVAGAGPLTVALVLPIEARPGLTHLFPAAGTVAVQNVIVGANGNVTILNPLAAGDEISFEFSFQVGG